MATTAPVTQQQQASNINVMAANEQARRLVVRRSVEMTQEIYANTVNPQTTQIINIVPRNVGIIKRFVIRITGTITNNTAAPVWLTDLSNLLSNVTFYDLQNNMRINTTGAHLYYLSSVKRRRMYGANLIYDYTQLPVAKNVLPVPYVETGNWMPVFAAPMSLAAGASANIAMQWEVPIAYSDDDLRGAVFANVVNTTMSLQMTLNSNALVQSDQDLMFAAFRTNHASGVAEPIVQPFWTSATINVYQVYQDQLPSAANGQLILPNIDLATVYQVTNTTLTGLTVNQDFPIPFTNFRDFFSVFVIFNHGGQYPYGDPDGADINYFSLTTANFTNVYKYDPQYAAFLQRDVTGTQLTGGWYYFSSRRHPIWTTQFGNQEIRVNPASADTGAYLFVMWEAMALQNTLVGSASLPAGG